MTTIHTRARRLLGLAATAALAATLATGCGSSDASNSASLANGADRAFVQQMIPHHQMAIQMAGSAQRKGEHPQTKALAAAIIAAQTREIGEMKPIAERVGVAPDQMPMGGMSAHMADDAAALGVPMNQTGMSMDMGALDSARPFDRAFVDMMIPHHQGTIRMARGELAKGGDPQLRTIAKAIVADQAKEIGQMNSWRTKWYGAAPPRRAASPRLEHHRIERLRPHRGSAPARSTFDPRRSHAVTGERGHRTPRATPASRQPRSMSSGARAKSLRGTSRGARWRQDHEAHLIAVAARLIGQPLAQHQRVERATVPRGRSRRPLPPILLDGSLRERLARQDPGRFWTTRERTPGDWIVVRASVAGLRPRRGKLVPEVRSRTGPPRPENDVPMPPQWVS